MVQEKQKEIHMNKTILGIDLGVTSCGWCLLERDEQGNIVKFIDSGVRIFNSPKEPKGDTLKNAKRREKRLSRRNNLRKNRRTKKLINLLLKEGFLSPEFIEKRNHTVELTHLINQELGDPFEIREKALNQKISKDELSYALIHLARRRGFRSSKKSLSNEEKKAQAEASEISEEMKKQKCRTIGEYVNKIGQDPTVGKRGKYLLRPLIENELDEILSAQRNFGNTISEEVENKIKDIVFFQRPLKLQKDKIGYCTFEAKKRTIKYHPDAQKFVIFERIRNLKVIEDIANKTPRVLTDNECLKLFEFLLSKKEASFKEIKELLDMNKEFIFNYEKNDDKFKGNEILNLFSSNTAKKYLKLSDKEKEALLTDMFTIFDEDAREKRLKEQWEDKFDSEKFVKDIIDNNTPPNI
jgi:CRISPR-associated endonuclease Csn1